MRQSLRNTSLSWVFGLLFLGAWAGQAVSGWHKYNEDEVAHAHLLHDGQGPQQIGMWAYLHTSHFWQATMENWQSEYLQFTLFILLTVWLLQRGSTQSKELDKAGRESDKDQLVGGEAKADSPAWAKVSGLRRAILENSLVLVMGVIWVWSWLAHSLAGWRNYNAEQLQHKQPTIAWLSYLHSSDFWFTTLQNWQSEFLAIGSMSVFAIYLRQRGSPESKPVGASHAATGVEG